jgi:reductive dehalogenase
MVLERDLETTEPLPYLGRSVRVVGDYASVDAAETPHEKNKRGELGKPLFNWYFNRTSQDPLGRTATASSAVDRRNTIEHVIAHAPRGKINPDRVEVTDPAAMTAHIKRVAKYLGASDVGIVRVHPSFLYTEGRYPEDGTGTSGPSQQPATAAQTAARYPYAIALVHAWDYDMGRAHRHRIGDAAYHFGAEKLRATYANLAAYIRELGYSVATRVATPTPTALAAGLGEMGRHGMLITERFGARVHLGDPILTDMPLVSGEPLDIGVADFCKICQKCANTCPTNSITAEGKSVVNGVEKYKINWATCYRLRPHVMQYWESCLTCVTVCPYTKPNVWWRAVAIQALKRTPKPMRGLTTRALKWTDDKFWGKLPRRRVRWMSYDSGHLTLPDGTVQPVDEKTGHYYPLKENTRRFDILKEKLKAKK